MTQRMIDARMKKLEALEAQRKELEDQIEAVKTEIQGEMGDDELIHFIMMYTVLRLLRA